MGGAQGPIARVTPDGIGPLGINEKEDGLEGHERGVAGLDEKRPL